MKSLKNAPSSSLRWWGLQSADAFDYVTSFLSAEGFAGPRTWSEGSLVPYDKLLTPNIKAVVGLSAFSADEGFAEFGCNVVLYSKTLAELEKKLYDGKDSSRKNVPFSPCLTIPLSYLKWCQDPVSGNPSWAMTLGLETKSPGVQTFVADFKTYIAPVIDALKSDDDLILILTRYLDRTKPSWVRSDPPTFARLSQKIDLLKSQRDRS